MVQFHQQCPQAANELSVHYWVDGIDYALSSGYWPYGDPDRFEAIGWRGSNAPHYRGESSLGYRVDVNTLCVASDFSFIDLERRNQSNDTVRRQVVNLGLSGVFLIDSGSSRAGDVRESVWRVEPRVALLGPDGATVQLGSDVAGRRHVLAVGGSSAVIRPLGDVYASEGHASPQKFSAVAARDSIPSYVVESPGSEPTLVALTSRESGGADNGYRLGRFESPEDWRIEDRASSLVVERSGSMVRVERAAGAVSARCSGERPMTDGDRIRQMEASFAELAARHPIFQPWTYYRLKATWVVGALFAAQIVLWGLLSIVGRPTLREYATGAFAVGWLCLGGYVTLVYLAQ